MKKIDILKDVCRWNVINFIRYFIDNSFKNKILMERIKEWYREAM